MPLSHGERRLKLESVKTRLEQSLLRWHYNLEQTRQDAARVEGLLAAWQKKWSSRREQIFRRLTMIESQLEKLVESAEPVVRLSVVGIPADADERTSLGPF